MNNLRVMQRHLPGLEDEIDRRQEALFMVLLDLLLAEEAGHRFSRRRLRRDVFDGVQLL